MSVLHAHTVCDYVHVDGGGGGNAAADDDDKSSCADDDDDGDGMEKALFRLTLTFLRVNITNVVRCFNCN